MAYERGPSLQQIRDNPFGHGTYLGVMDDGEYLCVKCIHEPEVHEGGEADGWRFEGSQVYWEGPPEQCAHCGDTIESEYGDPEEESLQSESGATP